MTVPHIFIIALFSAFVIVLMKVFLGITGRNRGESSPKMALMIVLLVVVAVAVLIELDMSSLNNPATNPFMPR